MRLHLHIGTHKTGSTSAQVLLHESGPILARANARYYTGFLEPQNHIELYMAAMREGRDSFARLKYRMPWTQELYDRTAREVGSFLDKARADGVDNVLFSTEGLSMLRYDDELERLKAIVRAGEHDVRIVLVLRNREDFLRSYKQTLLRHADRSPSPDPTSALYVEDDSWLADFGAIRSGYERAFGAGAMRLVDFDHEVATNGDVLPAFLRAFDLDPAEFGDLKRFHRNKSSRLRTLWARYVRRARLG